MQAKYLLVNGFCKIRKTKWDSSFLYTKHLPQILAIIRSLLCLCCLSSQQNTTHSETVWKGQSNLASEWRWATSGHLKRTTSQARHTARPEPNSRTTWTAFVYNRARIMNGFTAEVTSGFKQHSVNDLSYRISMSANLAVWPGLIPLPALLTKRLCQRVFSHLRKKRHTDTLSHTQSHLLFKETEYVWFSLLLLIYTKIKG